jgi:hypothetical protein
MVDLLRSVGEVAFAIMVRWGATYHAEAGGRRRFSSGWLHPSLIPAAPVGLGRLLAVLAFGLILALAVGGVILFRQVIRTTTTWTLPPPSCGRCAASRPH